MEHRKRDVKSSGSIKLGNLLVSRWTTKFSKTLLPPSGSQYSIHISFCDRMYIVWHGWMEMPDENNSLKLDPNTAHMRLNIVEPKVLHRLRQYKSLQNISYKRERHSTSSPFSYLCSTDASYLQLLTATLYKTLEHTPPGAKQPVVGVYFTALYRALASSHMRLLDHKQRRATVGRTPLN